MAVTDVLADGELSAQEADFVREFLVDLNATQAAIRARYSAKTAYSAGQRLLKRVEVIAEIRRAMAERAERTNVKADNVVRELARIAFANVSDIVAWGSREVQIGFDADGKRLPPDRITEAVMVRTELAPYVDAVESKDLSPDVSAAVSEVSLGKDGLKIKMHSKTQALEQLGRHLGLFAKDKERDPQEPIRLVIYGAGPRRTAAFDAIEGEAMVIEQQRG